MFFLTKRNTVFLNMFISQLAYCTSGLILHFMAGKKVLICQNYNPSLNSLPCLTFCKSVSKHLRSHKCFPLTIYTTKDARDRENLITF